MKILDRYILTSFLQTLATVFVILFFIFILQGIWLFIADLAGKDLDLWIIVKFLLLYSPRMIPLVLPLSVLLASIMTFGSFAENYEFAAMKSSGISLKRTMRPLSIFIFALAFISFWFANNIIPKSEFEFIKLRREIVQTKPAMAIAAGQFNQIGTTNIKVDKKSGENGEKLENVTIHIKNANGTGIKTIIKAKTGLLSSTNLNTLSLDLFDGYYYEDIFNVRKPNDPKQPFVKSAFEKNRINIDISKLNDNNSDDENVSSTTMLNINELNYTIDSLNVILNKEMNSYAETATIPIQVKLIKPKIDTTRVKSFQDINAILNHFSQDDQHRVMTLAVNVFENTTSNTSIKKTFLDEQRKNINSHWIILNEKFVIAASCILMFFIGAPLGAIIRKGGIGLPIVFAILIFITYHFINTFGKKVAQEDGMNPMLGAWLASLVLLPLAIFLTNRATNDRTVSLNLDWLIVPVKKLFEKKKKQTT